ncbi:thiamine-phosphate pyrophosphorylase [Acidimicrobium ferrooxidans DSM 10331]|uniref:Thiamine-phosphate synthase n=1 Tax=Acidimicrobium ferrooxidans (strain DSM 10331 / JCM 15462 / NBRC 103882 / ICP) TaxID=525909 RepID=C7LY53_ACIFD|nr:thiamine phosphate synthase [Acidimicrobium ferrooxidans]ACU53661.1 thiamine-phosphate pyrophosphorylase [Acidimicrobium ferrooxidans DSM 10331]
MTRSLGDRCLYLCVPLRRDLLAFVDATVRGGVDIVQLRAKDAPDGLVLRAARDLARLLARRGVPFIVNDRPDIALASDADGVHVGQDDLDVGTVRSLVGPDRIVGLSTHAPAEFNAASPLADYLSVGPVEPTPTKPGRPGTGRSYVAFAHRAAEARPRFITGNVTAQAIPALVAAGARRFVVVRALTEAPDPRQAAHDLRAAIELAREQPSWGTPGAATLTHNRRSSTPVL